MNYAQRMEVEKRNRNERNQLTLKKYGKAPIVNKQELDKVRAIIGQMSNRMTHMDYDLTDSLKCTDEAQEFLLSRARGDLDKCRNDMVNIAKLLGV